MEEISLQTSMMNFIKLIITSTIAIISISGCVVHYKDVQDKSSMKIIDYTSESILRYKLTDPDILTAGGFENLNKVFEEEKVFKGVEAYYEKAIPKKGLYVQIDTKWHLPSAPALIFGYLSVSTLTILPAWSNNDGYNLFYRVYKDGKHLKTYRYEVRRFASTWILYLPIAWINLITDSEDDAFEGTVHQFLRDAKMYLI